MMKPQNHHGKDLPPPPTPPPTSAHMPPIHIYIQKGNGSHTSCFSSCNARGHCWHPSSIQPVHASTAVTIAVTTAGAAGPPQPKLPPLSSCRCPPSFGSITTLASIELPFMRTLLLHERFPLPLLPQPHLPCSCCDRSQTTVSYQTQTNQEHAAEAYAQAAPSTYFQAVSCTHTSTQETAHTTAAIML